MSSFIKKNWPLLGIAILVITVFSYLGRSRKEIVRKPSMPGVVSSEGVKLEDIHFTHESAAEGVRWTLDAREVKISEDKNQISFTDFMLKIEPRDRYVIHLEGKAGHYDKSAGQLLLRGDLRGRTEDGYTIATESAVYNQNEGRLTSDEAVAIKGPAFSVEGRGLSYDVASEVLEIKSDVKTQITGKSWIS
jgi:LPS export ABC transporter protein LptC